MYQQKADPKWRITRILRTTPVQVIRADFRNTLKIQRIAKLAQILL
jgi:hypothetical protein